MNLARPFLSALRSPARAGLLAAAACPLASGAAAAQSAPDANEAFYQRAADCAAAMQADQFALVARARAGTPGLRPELIHLTKLGFAYVGTAYLRGLRDPRGSDMLKAATAEQKGWPAERHQALVAQCRVEAEKVYDEANSMEQWLVDNKATKRVDRFLSAPAPAPASAASR
jgi:hypothetical protein